MNRLLGSVGVCLIILVGMRPVCAQVRPEPLPLDTKNWPVGVAAKNELPKNRAYEYSFSDIQTSTIENWLAYINVKIPVDISGSLSGWVWAQRSERGWLNFSGYRLEGQITSPNLHVGDWEFKNSILRFGFVDNVWYVGRLSGDVFSNGSEEGIGKANFAATLVPGGDRLLQVSGGITQSQLKALLKAFNVDLDIENETGNLQVAANVPLGLSRDPNAWRATANVNLGGVRSLEIPRSSLSAKMNIEEGKWQIPAGTLTVIDQPIGFDGNGTLDPQLPYTASIRGDQLSITQLLRAAKQPELTSRLLGNIDVVGKVQGSVARLVGAASVAVRSPSIVVDGEALNAVRVEGVFDNWSAGQESLQLDLKSLAFAGGTIKGTVGWASLDSLKQLFPDQAQLEIQSIDLTQLPNSTSQVALAGEANGRIALTSRFDVDEKVHKWSTDSQVTVDNLSVANVFVGNTSLSLIKAIDEDQLKATLENLDESLQTVIDVQISNALEAGILNSIKDYRAAGSVEDFGMRLQLGTAGGEVPVVASGKFELSGNPQQWLSTGQLELADLSVTLPDQSIELTNVVANIREDAFRLERFQISDATSARIAGSALIRRDGQGTHLLNLRIVDLEIEPYVVSFAPTNLHGLIGSINLETRLKKAANSDDYLSGWNGNLRGRVANLEYRSSLIGDVAIESDIVGDQVTADIAGSVLGGELALKGTFSRQDLAAPRTEESSLPISASLVGVDLKRLMSLVAGPRVGSRYNGVASLQVETSEQQGDVQLRVNVPRFHFDRQELAKELNARLIYQNNQVLIVENVSGRLAGGRVDIQGEIQTDGEQPTGALRFTADQLNVQSLMVMFYPAYAKQYSGVVSYRGNIRVGREIALVGHSNIKNALVYGLPIQDVRNDLSITLSRGGVLKDIFARNVHGTAIGGRFDGEARIRRGSMYAFDAYGSVRGGKLDQLSRALGFDNIVGTGSFDAGTRLTSKDAFNIAALTGPMQLDFTSGDVKSVPVLSELGRIVPVLQLASTDIKNGTMRGQFGQGQFRFPVLLLNSDAFYLMANGSTSLLRGGLDVNGILQTGGSLNNQVVQGASQNLLASAFPQLLLLTEVNDLVRNRTVYFHVGGTPKHPRRAAQGRPNDRESIYTKFGPQFSSPNVHSSDR